MAFSGLYSRLHQYWCSSSWTLQCVLIKTPLTTVHEKSLPSKIINLQKKAIIVNLLAVLLMMLMVVPLVILVAIQVAVKMLADDNPEGNYYDMYTTISSKTNAESFCLSFVIFWTDIVDKKSFS